MAKYIEREGLIREIISDAASYVGTPGDVQKRNEQCNYAISCIEGALTANVVPVSELVGLRDRLYENDQITLWGLGRLNRLIAEYGGYGDGKAE